jgi:tetratricopeptide (TPR) repeat protein
MKIPALSLIRALHGVAAATNISEVDAQLVSARILSPGFPDANDDGGGSKPESIDSTPGLSFTDWQRAVSTGFPYADGSMSHELTCLALCIAFLHETVHQDKIATADDVDRCWSLVRGAISSKMSSQDLFTVARSAQGFLAVPLCSLIKEGRIVELFRLHVWLPDGKRGNSHFAIHSHQPFAQSWILAGHGHDHSYLVDPALNAQEATHAEYAVAWSDSAGKKHDTTYKTRQAYSRVENTGKLFRATKTATTVYRRNMTYSIPASAFHSTEVAPGEMFATLFYFDSSRGFVHDAGVLGPKHCEPFTQLRDPAGVTSGTLADVVEAARTWEMCMSEGRRHAQRAEWEHALRAFQEALGAADNLSGLHESFHGATQYRHLALGDLGNTNRRFGRYDIAKNILESTIAEMGPCAHRVELSGELGVTYRHMDRLDDAKRAFEGQYNTAQELDLDYEACRAIGNLGMANYQLSRQNSDDALLDLAIKQLTRRVMDARRLKEGLDAQGPVESIRWLNTLNRWETIGLARLSICHHARGNANEAIMSSFESIHMTKDPPDPTVKAMSRFFYGRALLLEGRRKEAMSLFNVPGTCTPAIAFAKEPSDEHRSYLRELMILGADMDIVDEQGYTALDHAVFNGDAEAEAIILEGLRKNAELKIAQRQAEAKLRKGYREIFQESMRPLLVRRSEGGLQALRRAYAKALRKDDQKRKLFDQLKFVPWSEFLNSGRLPLWYDGLVKEFMPISTGSEEAGTEFIIFISYRWINREPGAKSPDDTNHTQYRRIQSAVARFLRLHPSIDSSKLGIWIVSCLNLSNLCLSA